MFDVDLNQILRSLQNDWEREVEAYPSKCVGDDLASARYCYEEAVELLRRVSLGDLSGAAWIYAKADAEVDTLGYSRPIEWCKRIISIGEMFHLQHIRSIPWVGDRLPTMRVGGRLEHTPPAGWDWEDGETIFDDYGLHARVEEGIIKQIRWE